ncbi:hypothetical protein BJF84_07245 [Rhodococcus sp. CUA-806]|jgi:uncharacterized membrane protein YidH (DUF202 family)|nr:hypothetical protein BJF84_07245 [Rhodococcus sp. CUA-806]
MNILTIVGLVLVVVGIVAALAGAFRVQTHQKARIETQGPVALGGGVVDSIIKIIGDVIKDLINKLGDPDPKVKQTALGVLFVIIGIVVLIASAFVKVG